MNKWFINIAKYLKILSVVIFIIFEEIIWNKIGKPIYNTVKSLKIMNRFQDWVSNIDNKTALLIIFIAPFIAMELISILAIKALAFGAIITGIGLYVFKILLTIPVVIIFNTAKKQLVSFTIIRYGFGMILNFKRCATFRKVKNYIKELKYICVDFKDNYLDGDSSLTDELKKIYNDIKKI